MKNTTLEQELQTISLHNHTHASDGTWTPEELARTAKEAGIDVIALTDHDTFENVPRFLDACKQYGIQGIGGVEFDTCENSIEILSYFPHRDIPQPVLELAHKSTKGRQEYRERLLQTLNNYFGTEYSMSNISTALGRQAFTRHDVLRFFIPEVIANIEGVSTKKDAESWLSKKTSDKQSELYVRERKNPTPREVVQLVKENGGYTSIAHPARMKQVAFPWSSDQTGTPFETIVSELAEAGLDAIEWYGYQEKHMPEFTTKTKTKERENRHRTYINIYVEEVARKQGLDLTYGNDSHHPSDGRLTDKDMLWRARLSEELIT